MKRLFLSLAVAIGAFVPVAAQHTLDSLVMFVSLHRDGSADIQEQRYMHIGNDGTECFIKLYNMGDMTVDSLDVWEEVTDDEGNSHSLTYDVVDPWDVNRTRNQKAQHCGFNTVDQGQEICWGIGEPGRHTYIVNYRIHGLVKSYSDFDGFNHNFYEAGSPAANYARVIFHLDRDEYATIRVNQGDTIYRFPFRPDLFEVIGDRFSVKDSNDTTRVYHFDMADADVERDTLGTDSTSIWAFGYYGNIHFKDGNVVAKTTQSMNQSEKMIFMFRFKKGLFQPTLSYDDKSFEKDVKEVAFIDSDYPVDDEGNGSMSSLMGGDTTPMWERILYMVLGGVCCIGLPLLLIVRALFGKRIEKNRIQRQINKLLDGAPEYFHDLPLEGNLLRSRRILRALDETIDNSEIKLVEAYVMRLVDNNLIQLVKESSAEGGIKELFRIADPAEAEAALPKDSRGEDNNFCLQLHSILYRAAGADHILQPKEFTTMVDKDPLSVRPFARKLSELNGLKLKPANIKRDEAQQVYGFWKYLKDFTLVKERAIQEVALWKEYLTFATLFGIADQVRADMKRIAPDLQQFDELTRHIVEDTSTGTAALYSALSYSIADSITRTVNYETASERAARLAREARIARSSGSGGSSSYGGGGGYSGGGGSGVR